MRVRMLRFVSILLLSSALQAGPIYGAIFMEGRAVRGATVEVLVGNSSQGKAVTLDDGSYRVNVGTEGRCTLVVTVNDVRAAADVISSGNAARYNFAIIKGGGGYELRRQ